MNGLNEFATYMGYDLTEINGALVFLTETLSGEWISEVTPELQDLISETFEAHGEVAFDNIDLNWRPL